MKYRIIASIVVTVILAIVFLLFGLRPAQDADTQQETTEQTQ